MIQLSTRTKYIIAGTSVIAAFAVGRFSVQKPAIKSTTSLVTDSKTNQVKDTHTETTITTVKTPDGTIKTVEQINQIADTKTNSVINTQAHSETTITPPKTNTINISALIGNDFSHGFNITPIYGVSVSKEILGPITIGVYGMTNGIAGVSIGLNF